MYTTCVALRNLLCNARGSIWTPQKGGSDAGAAHPEDSGRAAHALQVLEVAVRCPLALARRLFRRRVGAAADELVEEHGCERALVLVGEEEGVEGYIG